MKLKTMGMLTLGVSFALAGCSDQGADTENQSVSEAVNYTVTGIEPGAGITEAAHNTISEYDNLAGWQLQESSTAGMLAELEQAINNEEPIVITGWTPHWIFEEYDLKMLEDPKKTLGEAEEIHTIAREGFQEDQPNAYQIIENFHWDIDDMQVVVREAVDIPYEEAAQNWVESNADKVAEWIDGAADGNGETLELVSTPWDTERASAHVIKLVLEQQGYDVVLTDVEPAVMFQAIASGSADFSVAPWLPLTHGAFLEQYGDEIDQVGINLEGAQNAFVVPAYVDVDSIEDLEPNQ